MREYQICKRCIMDTTDPDIEFDSDGICNHCKNYRKTAKRYICDDRKKGRDELNKIFARIKKSTRGRKYDCMIGLSGGMDSSYTAYLAVKSGLRVLGVHVDNEYDSDTAKENISNLTAALGMDIYTYRVDWQPYKDVHMAYLRASVVDIEAVTDHALAAVLYDTAAKRGIRYILSGYNIATEGIMPKSWFHNKNDLMNLKAIHSEFGSGDMKGFPTLGRRKKFYFQFIKGIKTIFPLNYVPYNKEETGSILARETGWKDYGVKHFESIFTRFYQNYILPEKFNIDKRKAHLSSLICSGQISRDEALKKMGEIIYPEKEFISDRDYVLSKLGLTSEEFEEIMRLPVRRHFDFKSDAGLIRIPKFIIRRVFNIRD